MSERYRAIAWNPEKIRYDLVLVGILFFYLTTFLTASWLLHPAITIETLLIRATATAAMLLLHVILCIGPLCRLDRRFLPFLYNRRHLGVTMFLLALTHGTFCLVQFHSLGNRNPFLSLLTSNTQYTSLGQFPFEVAGLAALCILFMMASTSHDFWLHNLTAPVWKLLHMLVYLAYALLVVHVGLGILQFETGLLPAIMMAGGLACILSLHLAAALRERSADRVGLDSQEEDRWVPFCRVDEIAENRAVVRPISGERVAVFRYEGKISALSNVCQHQNGPLGEGRIVDGCVTCPWHGYQYLPASGASPPPFQERVPTFLVRVVEGMVFVDPTPLPPGTHVEPARVAGGLP